MQDSSGRVFASPLLWKNWDKIVSYSLLRLTKTCYLSPKNVLFLQTIFIAVAGNHWKVICILTILTLEEEIREIKDYKNTMEYSYYFLNQAFNEEIWTEYVQIVVAYFCLALLPNSFFYLKNYY